MLKRVPVSGLTFLATIALLVPRVSIAAEIPAGEVRTPAGAALRWEMDFESGILWRAGHTGTDLNYLLLPQILTLKSPAVMRRPLKGGELVMRSRFSLLHEPIVKGPESHFTAVTASGILEWRSPAQTFAIFFSSGGGVGFLDSKGYETKGAQGQDFNLTWFLYPGIRFQGSERMNAALGIYYQHVSNGGMDKVNPGIDAVGPLLSLGWRF
ncbi:MAG TPA: acyloxyacyl hydrolase [Opitutaceae bacterium]|nr:acyloxyacyl hydrolase [Opitutaceae bacterium]